MNKHNFAPGLGFERTLVLVLTVATAFRARDCLVELVTGTDFAGVPAVNATAAALVIAILVSPFEGSSRTFWVRRYIRLANCGSAKSERGSDQVTRNCRRTLSKPSKFVPRAGNKGPMATVSRAGNTTLAA